MSTHLNKINNPGQVVFRSFNSKNSTYHIFRRLVQHRETAAAAQLCSHCSYQNNQESCSDQQCLKIPLFSTDKHLMGANTKSKSHLGCLSGRNKNQTTIIICHYNTSLSSDDVFTQLTQTHTDSKRPASILLPPEDSLTSPCLAA